MKKAILLILSLLGTSAIAADMLPRQCRFSDDEKQLLSDKEFFERIQELGCPGFIYQSPIRCMTYEVRRFLIQSKDYDTKDSKVMRCRARLHYLATDPGKASIVRYGDYHCYFEEPHHLYNDKFDNIKIVLNSDD